MLITQSAGKFLKRKNSINLGGELIDFSVPVVMGIVNVTPDSFYEGSKMEDEKVLLAKVEKMISDGAGIIDVSNEKPFYTFAQPIYLVAAGGPGGYAGIHHRRPVF